MSSDAWSEAEVHAVVEDYFGMFRCEMDGQDYNKAEHNRVLRQRLNARSKSSVELKHQNISAILDEMGLPYIPGYKPKHNYQQLLKDVVQDHLAANPDLRADMLRWGNRQSGGAQVVSILLVGGLGAAMAMVG